MSLSDLIKQQDIKASVRVATASALPANAYNSTTKVKTASGNASLNDTGIDGITDLAVGNRVLDKDAATGSQRGIFVIIDLGSASTPWKMIRAEDANTSAKVTSEMLVPVSEGTSNGGRIYQLTTADPITLDSTTLTFALETGMVTTTGAQELTNKTLTAMVVKTGLTASGSASNDFSASTGTFKTSTGDVYIGGNVNGNVSFAKESAHALAVVASTTAAAAGGNLTDAAGAGAAADAAVPGATGGTRTLAAGAGGAASSAQVGGAGGQSNVQGGAGGAGTAAQAAGSGGKLVLTSGDAGADGGGGGAASGDLEIDSGAASGAGTAGTVKIGAVSANAVEVGRAGKDVALKGATTTITSGQKLLAGTNEIIGTVSDKVNPVHIAHASQAVGDILYADSATTLAPLPDVAVGSYLRSGGVGAAPVYSTLKLPNAAAVGTIPHAASADTLTQLAPGAAGEVLTSAGAGASLVWSSPLGTIGKKTLTIAGGVRAKLQPSVDLGTTGIDTVLQNSVTGTGGNSITLTTVADGVAKAGSIAVVGNAITVHYQDGVTQVSDFEALFPAVCTDGTVSVKTTGTAITVLAAPGDTFGPSNFINGAASATLTAAAVSAAIALDTALPANARLLGASIGEGSFTGFNNSGGGCTATISIEGTGGTADISAAVNVAAGQTGFPKIGAAGGQGYPMALHSSEQLTATFTSNVNLNTIDTGSVVVNVLYAVKA